MSDFHCFDIVVPLVDAPVNIYFTWMLSDNEVEIFNEDMFSDSDTSMEDRCSYCTFIRNGDGPESVDIVLDEVNWVTWAHEAFHALIYIDNVADNCPMTTFDGQEWGAMILSFILDAISDEFELYKNVASNT